MNDIELLKNMVLIKSFSGKEKEFADYLLDVTRQMRFECEIDEVGNLIAVCGKGKRTVVLTSHMDTVEGEIAVREENNKLYGRGSVDAKGCLAAMIMAASDFVDSEDLRIIVAGVVEEEVSTNKGSGHISKKFNPDYCIVGEPSSWDAVTIGYKGVLGFNYKLKKPRSHYSASKSAVLEVNEFINSLRELADKGNSFDTVNLEIRSLNSSSHEAEMYVVLRVPMDFGFEKTKKYIDKIRKNAVVEYDQELQAIVADKNNKLVRAFMKSIRQNGGDFKFKKKTGTSDMNVLGDKWGCPMVAYGPGDSRLDHTDDEHIDLDEYKRSITVLKGVLGNLS